jgi:hypothetical protein
LNESGPLTPRIENDGRGCWGAALGGALGGVGSAFAAIVATFWILNPGTDNYAGGAATGLVALIVGVAVSPLGLAVGAWIGFAAGVRQRR